MIHKLSTIPRGCKDKSGFIEDITVGKISDFLYSIYRLFDVSKYYLYDFENFQNFRKHAEYESRMYHLKFHTRFFVIKDTRKLSGFKINNDLLRYYKE